MPLNEIEAKIKSVLVDKLQFDPVILQDCSLLTPLLGRGLGLDSIAAMVLASGIEEEFDIQVDDEDLSEALFENLASLVHYVDLKITKGDNHQ
jgi:acyl carrier protein